MTTAVPAIDFQKQLRIVPLPSSAALSDFKSGEREIDRNLNKCCGWDAIYRSRVYCAYLRDDPVLYGFYCISMHAHEAAIVAEFFVRSEDDSRNFVPFI